MKIIHTLRLNQSTPDAAQQLFKTLSETSNAIEARQRAMRNKECSKLDSNTEKDLSVIQSESEPKQSSFENSDLELKTESISDPTSFKKQTMHILNQKENDDASSKEPHELSADK